MKNLLIGLIGRETASKVRRSVFLWVRRATFKLLNALDPSFQANFKNNFAKMIGSDTGNSKLLGDVAVSASLKREEKNIPQRSISLGIAMDHAVVLSTDDSVASLEAIQFLVSGIFKDAKLTNYVLTSIAESLDGGQSLAEIEKIVGAFLEREAEDDCHENCRVLLKLHKEESNENKRAYTTQDKLRPSAVFWPNPTDATNLRSIYDELPYVVSEGFINSTTAVGSAGSCFASEIAIALQDESFNYVVTEPNVGLDGSYRFMTPSERPVSCAAWGTIFNTPSFKQLVEKAFEERHLPKILWNSRPNGADRYYDPFRENIEFASPEAFEENYEKHKTATREAFEKLDVFVITLGLNEVWYFKADGSAFSRSPWRIAPSLVERRILTVEENVADLQRMLDILRVHNPKIKMIVTLSPVGLHATFRADTQHVITANSHSKAVLRVAAEEFVRRNKDVFYFPSYEVVNFCTQNPYLPDQRNVARGTVANVMRLFKEMYVA